MEAPIEFLRQQHKQFEHVEPNFEKWLSEIEAIRESHETRVSKQVARVSLAVACLIFLGIGLIFF